MARCCACGKEFKYSAVKGTGQQLFKGSYACQECCDLVGIKKGIAGSFKATTYDEVKFLKKYVEKCQNAKEKLDDAIIRKDKEKEEFRKELKDSTKHIGCKEQSEDKYVCNRCGNIWYFGAFDQIKNIHNVLMLTTYNINQLKNPSKCPKCGSEASTHKKVKFWIDKNGNCVDTEE